MNSDTDNASIPKPLVLCILDGWGSRAPASDNAISQARTPFFDHAIEHYPNSQLFTSGLAVGLPEGQMGNSEVGHMTIGSGRIAMQSLPRIDQAIADGSLNTMPAMQEAITQWKRHDGSCHIMGLCSPGGVHAHQRHISFMAKMIANAGAKVYIHAFLDGRDTPPESAGECLAWLEKEIADSSAISIATVSGRYYAMDRDQRWDRTELAYQAIVHGVGERAADAASALQHSYADNKTDEFVLPRVIGDYQGMKDGDGFVMTNFRADRARQLLAALTLENVAKFDITARPKLSHNIGMVDYETTIDQQLSTLFPSTSMQYTLGEVLAANQKTQLRIAETEKYAHVTFFFNGGREAPYDGEERILIPSPDVATYDLKPEMSAQAVTDAMIDAIEHDRFDVIIANYANTDMVGHTGSLTAAIRAVEAVDQELMRLAEAIKAKNGALLITADHGNAEQMLDEEHHPHTQHTTGPVPLIAITPERDKTLHDGRLSDIAPTLLAMLEIPQPQDMSGTSLFNPKR